MQAHHLGWEGGSTHTASILLASLNWCATQPLCRGNLGIPRSEMPQIRPHAIPAFIQYVRDSGVGIRKTSRPVKELRATQREINGDVVEDLAQRGLKELLQARAMFASEDGYILDGHHRWAALLTKDPEQDVDLQEIQAPVQAMLALARAFPGVEYSSRLAVRVATAYLRIHP